MHTHWEINPYKRRGKKMDISTKKVKIVRYARELGFTTQFFSTLLHVVSPEGDR